MNKPLKIIFITVITILMLASFASCCLYGYIKLFAPDKSVSYTVKGGVLDGVEDENLKFIFNIRRYDDLFEIRLNSFIDETKEEVYGTGIQFFNPTFATYTHQEGEWFYYNHIQEYFAIPFYVYNTYQDNSYTLDTFAPEKTTVQKAIDNANLLYKNAYFTITLGSDIYKFTFKDENIVTRTKKWLFTTEDYSYHNNFMKLCYDLYQSSKSFKEGINQVYLFNFVDYLNFEKYDEKSKQYIEIADKKSEEYTLVTKHMKAFFGVKVDRYKRNVEKASESLFNSVAGVYSYNIGENTMATDYFVGESRICLTENAFEYKFDETMGHFPVLKESVKVELLKYENISIDIDFNMTILKNNKVKMLTIDKTKMNLGNLKIHKITKTTYTDAGEIESSEVVNV